MQNFFATLGEQRGRCIVATGHVGEQQIQRQELRGVRLGGRDSEFGSGQYVYVVFGCCRQRGARGVGYRHCARALLARHRERLDQIR
ncbi:Uncharacterised protein [Mycobacteroides abscessus subsp. abscessus]|nr:Uncharacterised protein [Mycobacteroides abscessus subsp. abscessus]